MNIQKAGRITANHNKLRAIEIAEGALLADIAVLLQLVAIYLPLVDLRKFLHG
jgi:hypothetical protein